MTMNRQRTENRIGKEMKFFMTKIDKLSYPGLCKGLNDFGLKTLSKRIAKK